MTAKTPLFHAVRLAHQSCDRLLEMALSDIGITPRQYVVLEAISQMENPTQTQIVSKTGVDRSTMTDVLMRLQDRRLITRKRKMQDRRAHDLALTLKGERALREARDVVDTVDARIWSRASKSSDPMDMLAAIIGAGDAPRPAK